VPTKDNSNCWGKSAGRSEGKISRLRSERSRGVKISGPLRRGGGGKDETQTGEGNVVKRRRGGKKRRGEGAKSRQVLKGVKRRKRGSEAKKDMAKRVTLEKS